jgi:hypothetical protein
MLNRLGVPLRDSNLPARPVSMPRVNLPDLDVEDIAAEAREAAARVRTIRLGRDAWEQIAKSGSFSLWVPALAAWRLLGRTGQAWLDEGTGTGRRTQHGGRAAPVREVERHVAAMRRLRRG